MANSLSYNNKLTSRENEALDLLINGKSNKQIALEMGISEKTAEKHIASIYRKINACNRAEAIRWGLEQKNSGRDFPHEDSSDFPHSTVYRRLLRSRQERRILMRKLNLLVSITAGILLGIIAIGMGIPRILMETQSVRASSKIDDILTLVLNSHTKWDTAKGEAEITWYDPNGGEKTQTYVNQFVIYQPLSAYIDGYNKNEPGFNDQELWISDGMKIYDLNKQSKTYTEGSLPKFANDLSVMPRNLSEVKTDTVYDHPFSLLIPAPIKEYIYPEWFAQGNPTSAYTLVGEDNLLGRSTWVVSLKYATGQATAWIDQSIGMILKYSREENGRKIVEVNITSIEVNMPIDSSIFSVPADYRPNGQP
ncbi:MAG: helix-turn-helix transcriptional regulator [Chloroflexi bacterium]|nr:helix-turn-helix transcriptional regulator [Chloroflexota bacterium]MBI3340929.1 helix-turn-helix transcriptional regulator [Chloroflexota bacterium]